MFGRKIPRNNLGDLFKDSYLKIRSILYDNSDFISQSDYSIKDGIGHELFAFLYAISVYYITLVKKSLRDTVFIDLASVCKTLFANYLDPFFYRRQSFYNRIAESGDIRNDWFMSTYPNQPDIRMFIAFGDCLYNSDCVNNYDNAAVSLRSIFERMEFNKMMFQIQDVLQDYCKAVSNL